jgi:hypothetical protein
VRRSEGELGPSLPVAFDMLLICRGLAMVAVAIEAALPVP